MGIGGSCNLQKMANVCEMFRCVTKIEGQARNSGSDTDTWILTLSPNTMFNKEPVTKTFMKIGLNPTSIRLPPGDEANLDARTEVAVKQVHKALGLQYELEVYDKVIGPILASHVCPNFLRPYLVSYNCTFKDLLHALQQGLPDVDADTRQELLLRNVDYMTNGKPGRPAINDQTGLVLGHAPDENPAWRFMVLTTEYETVTPYYNFLRPEYDIQFLDRAAVLMQILVALYVMQKTQLMHQDLHAGNILVQALPEVTTFTYSINGEVFSCESRYKALVYDFDLASCTSLGPNIRRGDELAPFKKNHDLVRLYKSLTPQGPRTNVTLTTQYRTLMHKVFDLKDIRHDRDVYHSKGEEIKLPLLSAIQFMSTAFREVKPSSTPYIIDDDMFLSNGALNIDHQLMKNIRQTNSQYEDEIIACRNALQKSEQEYAELQRRMTFLDAKLSYAQSLLRKQHRTPYARR